MIVDFNTKASRIDKEEISGSKEKLIQKKISHKSKKKSSEAASTDQTKFSQTISYQKDPEFIQFLFDQTIVPLVEALQKSGIVKKVWSSSNLKTIRDAAANSLLYSLLKGVAEKSIALRMETLQLALLKIPTMSPNEYGTRRAPLANVAVEHCVKRLIKNKNDKNTENVWNSEEGKQFFVDLGLLSEQYSIPMDVLLYKLETAAYQDPVLQKFITATTYPLYESILEIAYKHKDDINDKVQRAIVKESEPYFSESLRDAYFLFSWGLDKSLQNLKKDFERAHLFRKNTIATVRLMKKAERMKHLNFLNLKQVPQGHVVERKSIFIEKVDYILTIAKETKTNLVKVMTLTKKGTEDVDVYLFGQIVKDPDEVPDSEKELHLFRFEITVGTNLVWLKKADNAAKKAIMDEFENNKYIPSVHTSIEFKNEIILVEIFKQLGKSLNSRTRAGTIDTFLETLDPKDIDNEETAESKYDDEFKEEFTNLLEDSLGGPINHYLANCYHNGDLDMIVPNGTNDQKFIKPLTKLSIARIQKVAKNSWRRKEYPLKWVKKSILAAGYDDPVNPVDVGDAPQSRKAEKINLQPAQELFKTALKKKNSDKILLGLVEIISESISDAFNAHKKDESVIKMLEDNFIKENLDDIFEETSTEKKVAGIFKKILVEWDLKCTDKQLALFSKFFKESALNQS